MGSVSGNGVRIHCAHDHVVTTGELKENPKNPNKHSESQIELLAKIIKAQGWRNPIVISTRSGFITKGHARLAAAKKLGLRTVPVDKQDYPSEQAEIEDMLADNRIAELSDMSIPDVKNLIDELDKAGADLDLTGYDAAAIEALAAAFVEPQPEISDSDDNAGARKSDPKSKLGDIYQLGEHRLMCGDATKKEDIDKLLNGKKVDILITDPPYGVNYSDKNEMLNEFDNGNRIQNNMVNDNIEDYRQFFHGFLNFIPMSEYNTCFIFMSGKELHSLRLAFEDAEFYCSDYLVWIKNNHVLGRKDCNAKHEFILYGWKGKHKFYGGSTTTVLEYDRSIKSDLHPTMKPIKLISKLIIDGSQKNSIAFDPFGGSGSTLIACEKTHRICHMMEIDPGYVDVIIDRWEKLTGNKASRLPNKATQ